MKADFAIPQGKLIEYSRVKIQEQGDKNKDFKTTNPKTSKRLQNLEPKLQATLPINIIKKLDFSSSIHNSKTKIASQTQELNDEIFSSIISNDISTLEEIINSGLVDVNSQNPLGQTPLHIACE